jgi:nucleotide-binding universal stress UspA family protein/predicted transcriptional regulator
MAFPYRKIMCPIDFDDSSLDAIDTAASIARQNDGSLTLVHIVPMIVQPTVMAVRFDLYKEQAEAARVHLTEIVRTRLRGIKCELSVHNGEPAQTILKIERKLAPDLLVMSTHGRKGFSHFFLGSVAELVLRGASCPVLTTRAAQRDKNTIAGWMTTSPVTASPKERLGSVRAKMLHDDLCCVPVVEAGRLLGIVSDHDLHRHLAQEDHLEVGQVMDPGETLISVSPSTSLKEAARLLQELKLQGLPVVAEEKLVGVITVSDVLRAFAESG